MGLDKLMPSTAMVLLWLAVLSGLAVGIVLLGPAAPAFAFVGALGLTATQASMVSFSLISVAAVWVSAIKSMLMETAVKRSVRPFWWASVRAGRLGLACLPVVVLILAATLPFSWPILITLSLAVPIVFMVVQSAIAHWVTGKLCGVSKSQSTMFVSMYLMLGADPNVCTTDNKKNRL